jgi:hypothetical protein
MNQRAGKKHPASLRDNDSIRLGDLIRFCRDAKEALEDAGDTDSALRFEILQEYLLEDFRGGSLTFKTKALGL